MKSRGSGTNSKGCNMKQWDSGTTTTPKHSPSNSLSFRLVNYFTHYQAYINTFKTNCIATCLANGAAARNLVAAVATSPTTTSLQASSTSSGTFPIIRHSVSSFLFFFLLFFNRCSLFLLPAPVTHSGTSSTAHPEVVPTPTSQTTVTPMTQLDLWFIIVFCEIVVFCEIIIIVLWDYCLL
jgi:hypothetical protein